MTDREYAQERAFRRYATLANRAGLKDINDPIVDKYVKDYQAFVPESREFILKRIGLLPYNEADEQRLDRLRHAGGY